MGQHEIPREERYQMRVKFDFPKYSGYKHWKPQDELQPLNYSYDGCLYIRYTRDLKEYTLNTTLTLHAGRHTLGLLTLI